MSRGAVTEARGATRWNLRSLIDRLITAVDEMVDYRAWVPLRIGAGILAVVHLAPFLADAAAGVIYRDRYWVPYVIAMPELPRSLYVAALWAGAAGGVLLAVGLFTRLAGILTASVVLYNVALSQTHYHHNRAFLAILLVALALVPVGGAVSLDVVVRRRRDRPVVTTARRWPLTLVRFQLAAVYLASGVSKLLDPDWFGGVVTQLRVERWLEAGGEGPGSGALAQMMQAPVLHDAAAPIIVLTEVFIGAGLLVPRLRLAAIWLAVLFHAAIQLTADVQVFSWAALVALVVWVRPTGPDREVTLGADAPWWATAIRPLDWTGRFHVIQHQHPSAAVTLTGIGGLTYTGREATLRILRLLPLTFPVAWPVSVGSGRTVHSGAVNGDGRPG